MKILFYLTRFPGFGGIESVTDLVANKLIDDGYEISILAHLSQSRLSKLSSRCNIYFMPDKDNWSSPVNINFAVNLLKSNQFDAIVYQDSYAPTHKLVCRLSKQFSIPLYVFEHSTPLYQRISRKSSISSNFIKKWLRIIISYPMEDMMMKRRRKLLLKNCTKYILLSDTYIPEMDIVIGSTHYSGRDKIISIPNPINFLNEVYPIKEKLILFVGRLEPVKRVDLMLDVWSKIENKYPDWHFSIVGDGSELDYLKDKTANLGLKHVSFEGYSDPQPFYKKASIFWMTSLYEGWGMTLIESMQNYCVPIAMDSYSSVRDIIEDRKTGMIARNGDLHHFMIQTSELIENRCILCDIAQSAHDSIRRFDIAVVIEKWKDLLNSRDK